VNALRDAVDAKLPEKRIAKLRDEIVSLVRVHYRNVDDSLKRAMPLTAELEKLSASLWTMKRWRKAKPRDLERLIERYRGKQLEKQPPVSASQSVEAVANIGPPTNAKDNQ
jgi:hypothetical protein